MQHVKEYLRDKKYQAIITLTNDGCILTTPKHIELPLAVNKLVISYNIDKENTLHCIISNQGQDDIVSEVHNVPQYAKRLAICTAFLKNCRLLNYDANVLFYYNQHGEEITNDIFFHSLPFEMSTDDIVLEEFLNDIVALILNYGYSEKYVDIAKKYGILDGLTVIKKILIAEDNYE